MDNFSVSSFLFGAALMLLAVIAVELVAIEKQLSAGRLGGCAPQTFEAGGWKTAVKRISH